MESTKVGDINSTAKGSGARYNGGKPAMDLIPLHALVGAYSNQWDEPAHKVLTQLAYWQAEGKVFPLTWATQLFSPAAWADCANVFDYGRKKYADWNWAKGMAWSVPLACAVRHLVAILNGEELDQESGLPHRGHALCNICMLITFHTTYPEGDDRPRYLAKPHA